MKFSILIILYLACSSFGSPMNKTTVERQPRAFDLLANARNRINEVLTSLSNAAQQTSVSLETFRIGIAESATQFNERVNNDIRKLRASIVEVVNNLTGMLGEAAEGITTCAETAVQRTEETLLLTLGGVIDCGESILNDVIHIIETLLQATLGSSQFTERTADELQGCYNTTSSTDIILLARCVGSLAVQTEIKSTSYFAESALLFGRISFALVALPARLEMCAGSGLMRAGVDIARILANLLGCLSSSVINALSLSETDSSSLTKVL